MADTPMTGPDAPRPGLTRRQAYEARIRKRSLVVAASSTAAVILALIILIPLAPGWEAVKKSFFNGDVFARTFPGLLEAFLLDVAIFAWSAPLIFLLGLLIATIGQDPVGGINRYNFGLTDLAAGIAFVPAILGFFAVSEIFVQAERKAAGKYKAPKVSMTFPSWMELWMHKIAVVRSILVGFFCGILPGIGATLAAFMGYGEAVRWSKNREEFGTGKLEGVISSWPY